ncbi:MAG: dethiobiotin synthase [Dehalococcoidia bacterium]|nr:dethiobiotin synthase [Dehalococcoidia bacterium]
MSRGLFITGSDTGTGKTMVTAGIVRWLRKRGVDAVPMKPVQTGGEMQGGRLVAPDLEFSLSASGIQPVGDELQAMAPYVYAPACSPHLAGRMAGRYPDPCRIKECAEVLLQNHSVVVVEGAGGVMTPLNEDLTMLDLMRTLAYPVVLVSRSRLGAISHTLLAIHALRSSGMKLVGVVFDSVDQHQPDDRFIEEDNPKAVARFGDVRVLGTVRHFDKMDPRNEQTWVAFEQDMTGLENIYRELAL